jgi:hypothetical protein
MSSAIVSGLFAIVGTTVGWALSEAGAGWRSVAERRREQQAEAAGRVFEAARIAVAICEGVRWLIQVDVAKRVHGEGIDHETYEAKAMQLAEYLAQLRLIPLAVTAKGPRPALPQIVILVDRAQVLWDNFAATSRNSIGITPAPLLSACDEIAQIAQELVSQP